MKNSNDKHKINYVITTKTIDTIDLFGDILCEMIKSNHPDISVSTQTIIKNNNLKLLGLIMSTSSNLSPAINLNAYYADYKNGVSIFDIYNQILITYEKCKNEAEEDISLQIIYDFELAKHLLCYKLINQKNNKEWLKTVPYIPFLDLAIVLYLLIPFNDTDFGTVYISNTLLDIWNFHDVSSLFKLAHSNTQRKFIANIKPISNILDDIMDTLNEDSAFFLHEIEELQLFDNDNSMYVATNDHMINGACVILYDNMLRDFANEIGGDFYVLPSSVHEIILVPTKDDLSVSYLSDMLSDVNRTSLSADEVLSDNVYLYRADTECLEIARYE